MKNYYTENYKPDHTKFGGHIYLSDFETDYRGKDTPNGSEIAKRIAADFNFDIQCKKNIENKAKYGSCNYSLRKEKG